MKISEHTPADFIAPLVINGLHGRVMHIPAQKKNKHKEILLVYGHHSALERMYAIAANLAEFGSVTIPDLPGFGGMDSFYHLHEKPTLDAMADYLATFIKLRFKKRPIVIGGMSYGFLVVTRMLQKYPEMTKQVELLISMVGFMHHEDFTLSKRRQLVYKNLARVCSTAIMAGFVRYTVLQPFVLKTIYRLQANSHPKMKGASPDELATRLNFEVFLWHANDVRTYMYTSVVFLGIDMTNTQIDLPVVHIAVDADQYFDNRRVKKHLAMVYNNVTIYKAHIANHAPTVISDVKDAAGFIPPQLRKILLKKPKARK